MIVRKKLLLLGDNLFGENSLLQTASFFAYRILFFFFSTYFKLRFHQIESIYLRHSLAEKKGFNIFYSDIDTTFVLKDLSALDQVLGHFLLFKKVFIMFDLPEFYTTQEEELLGHLRKPEVAPFLEVIWYIRKTNWTLSTDEKDPYEIKKRKRSLTKGQEKISQEVIKNGVLSLANLKSFNRFFSTSKDEVCLYSFFLSTNTNNALRLCMSAKDFFHFNGLMAGENFVDFEGQSKNNELKKIKYAIEVRELLHTLNSIRVGQYFKQDVTALLEWKNYLESRSAATNLVNT